MRKVYVTILMALILPNWASEAQASGLVQPLRCFDGKYSFGIAAITEEPGNKNLWIITAETQQQSDFSPILTGPSSKTMADWGHVVVTMWVEKGECKKLSNQDGLMSCATNWGTIKIDYYEEFFESRRILILPVTDFKFQAREVDGEIVVDLSYSSSSVRSPSGSLQMKFAADPKGLCAGGAMGRSPTLPPTSAL